MEKIEDFNQKIKELSLMSVEDIKSKNPMAVNMVDFNSFIKFDEGSDMSKYICGIDPADINQTSKVGVMLQSGTIEIKPRQTGISDSQFGLYLQKLYKHIFNGK